VKRTEELPQRNGRTARSLPSDWPTRLDEFLVQYDERGGPSELMEVNLDLGSFVFDLVAERVVIAYAFSTAQLTKRDGSRIRGFPNVNASVQKVMGQSAFVADKGHFLGHASGGSLDINLFPQRRELNRGWSEEGKTFRAMERHVSENDSTFFYHRPIYDDSSWIPSLLEYGVFKEDNSWWVETFRNK
jgi:hypothetical protein